MKKAVTINLAKLVTDNGVLLVDDDNIHEVITVEGVEPPVVNFETGEVIKPGKLLNVKRGFSKLR